MSAEAELEMIAFGTCPACGQFHQLVDGEPCPSARLATIARVCHEANRAYCATIGDLSQLPWDDAPQWQRESAIAGVEFSVAHPDAPPSASHESWLAEKERTGWRYGPVKDAEKKEHPCFVPYDELPLDQRRKDALFVAIVRALA